MLFRPQNHFLIPHVVFEKNRFFDQKIGFSPHSGLGAKTHFLPKKNGFFQSSSNFQGMVPTRFGPA